MLRAMGVGGALLLASAHGLNLVSGVYAGYAEARLDQANDLSLPAAAALAARLTPWSERRLALAGWILSTQGADGPAETHYRAALRWAPADPLLLAEYAQSLARRDRFDGAALWATQQAQRLAPTSSAVQSTIAALGLSYWRRGSPELQRAWLLAMRYELDHNRASFLNHVLVRGQAGMFCSDAGQQLGEQRWCGEITARAAACRDSADDYVLCMNAP